MNTQAPGPTPWALVTGSSSGIGHVTALKLAEDGYSVVVCGRDPARTAETREVIVAAGGRATALIADFSSPAA